MSASETDTSAEPAGAVLMLAVKRGDADAFRRLVERYQATVFDAVCRQIGNRSIAEELTQEVFLRIWRARGRYEPRAKFETWLYRIVMNLCANASLYGRRRRALSLDRTGPGRDEETPGRERVADPAGRTPLEDLEREELRRKVKEAIQQLPEQQRAALVLARYRGLSCREIGEALDLSVEAVKSLLFRARQNLRARLQEYVDPEREET